MLEQPYHRQMLADVQRLLNAMPMRYGVVIDDARAAAYEVLIACAKNDAHLMAIANRMTEGEFFPTPFDIRRIAVEEYRDAITVPKYEPPPPMTPEEEAELRELTAQVTAAIRERSRRSRQVFEVPTNEELNKRILDAHNRKATDQ